MRYTVKKQNAIAAAAKIAAQHNISDVCDNYEDVANALVELATGINTESEHYVAARSDFDTLLEELL